MPVSIRITDPDTGRNLTLDDRRRDLVLVELKRVRRFGAPDSRVPLPIAADCVIEIEDNGRIARYLVLSETVLLDVQQRRVYQFYMGLQLLDWLAAP